MNAFVRVLNWILLLVSYLTGEESPVVRTSLGALRGSWLESRSGRKFQAFQGIPYGKPPVGELRFQAPRPVDAWEGIRDASIPGSACVQSNIMSISPVVTGVEDCLYLSVFTHNVTGRAPVIFHIHGGGLVFGAASMSDPSFLMDHDVVIVNINYRLGIMGFLSLETETAPGNQGMKDQVLALKWVQEHIASFGGDPRRVTLHGESAGAMSVSHHLVSPLSKGLFHGAIAESGSVYNLRALMAPGYVRNLTLRLAEMTGCRNQTSKDEEGIIQTDEEVLECLRRLEAIYLTSQQINFREWQTDPDWTFKPVFEKGPNAFLTCPMSEWKHAQVPVLMGTTSAEGFPRTKLFLDYNMSWDWFSDNFETVAPISLGYGKTALNPNEVTNKIRSYYFPRPKIIDNGWDKVVQLYTDSWYAMGIAEGADKHSAENDVFFYLFDYLGEGMREMFPNSTILVGAPHVSETLYLMQMKFPSVSPALQAQDLAGEDLALSKKLVKLWTDFVKYGTPTPDEATDLTWPTWKADNTLYLHISNTGFKIQTDFAEDRRKFWSDLDYKGAYALC